MHSLQKSQGQVFAFQFSQKSFQKRTPESEPPKKTKYGDQPWHKGGGEEKHNNTTHPAGKENLPKQITNTNFSQFLGKSPRKFNQNTSHTKP
jgi:hypothetical protein